MKNPLPGHDSEKEKQKMTDPLPDNIDIDQIEDMNELRDLGDQINERSLELLVEGMDADIPPEDLYRSLVTALHNDMAMLPPLMMATRLTSALFDLADKEIVRRMRLDHGTGPDDIPGHRG